MNIFKTSLLVLAISTLIVISETSKADDLCDKMLKEYMQALSPSKGASFDMTSADRSHWEYWRVRVLSENKGPCEAVKQTPALKEIYERFGGK